MRVTVTIALDVWTFPILNGSLASHDYFYLYCVNLSLSLPVFLSPVPLAPG